MIIKNIRGPVGKWLYMDKKRRVTRKNRDDIHDFLAMIQGVAEILEAHELLFPTKVTLSHWITYQSQLDTTSPVEEESDAYVTISRNEGAQGIVSRCEETLRHREQARSVLYPRDIDVVGTGIVFDAYGQRQELPDVIWLTCYTLTHYAVEVVTQSDAWMPYTLRADPQEEVFLQNAPRLELALQEIARWLGVEPIIDTSNYAVMEGYYLDNYRDLNGDPEPAYLGDDDEYVRTVDSYDPEHALSDPSKNRIGDTQTVAHRS